MEMGGRRNPVRAAALVLVLAVGTGCGDHEDAGLQCICVGDASIDAIDPTACDPLAQAGCGPGQKCTWSWDQLPPTGQSTPTPEGQVTCVADGALAAGADCGARQLGGDPCARGLACIDGRCEPICDPLGGGTGAACTADQVCTTHAPVFERGGVVIAGVCDPRP